MAISLTAYRAIIDLIVSLHRSLTRREQSNKTGHMTGAIRAVHPITGRGGKSLTDVWAQGPQSYLGLTVEGFPNFFMTLKAINEEGELVDLDNDEDDEVEKKIMIRRSPDAGLSIYVPKKDLEEPIVESEYETLWGGWIKVANGWVLDLPEMPSSTPLPITIDAKKRGGKGDDP